MRSSSTVAHMLVYAKTLRQGFELLAQFERLIYDGQSAWTLIEHAQSFTVRQSGWRASTPRARVFTGESLITGILKLVRVYFANARPLAARFEHAAPAYSREYERVFGPVVMFGQPWNELEFSQALLDAPSPQADSDMYAAQRTIAERRLLQVTQDAPYALRVRELMLRRFPERTNMAAVARALGLSERGLRNALSDEGSSYREVEHETLGSLARELLQDQQRTIQEVAYQMGFSDAATFHRAVKRWTGLTPSALRERKL